MSQPFVSPPQPESAPALRYCQDCQGHYWTDYPHVCPADDPLDAASGICLALLASFVGYALLLAAFDLRFGWPF